MMREFNWEKMKRDALQVIPNSREIYSDKIAPIIVIKALQDSKKSPEEIILKIQKDTKEAILAWDIRMFKDLIIRCRERKVYIVPLSQNIDDMQVEMNQDSEWVLVVSY